jgi:hypothetical protein
LHNGGTIIDPDHTFSPEALGWYSDENVGSGCWIRVFSGKINVKWFGAKGNRTNNDTNSLQAAVDCSINTLNTLYIPAGKYYITTAIVLDNIKTLNSYTIIGDGGGDGYSQSFNQNTVIYTDDCNAFELVGYYPASAISIEKIKITGNGNSAISGYLLYIGDIHRQIKNVYLTEVMASYASGLLHMYSSTGTNGPYVTITRAYTGSTYKVVYNENVSSTIFTINDSLFHGTSASALDFTSGGEVSIINTWFESCSPAALQNESSNFFKIALHNVYFENKGSLSDSTKTAWNCGNNTTLIFTGKTNFAFMNDAPSTIRHSSMLYNYTNTNIPILADCGIVMTPDSVSLYKGSGHIHKLAIPLNAGIKFAGANTNTDLSPRTLAGRSICISNISSSMPTELQNKYYPGTLLTFAGDDLDTSTYADDRLLVASFLYKSSNINNGFLYSYFTIDGVNIDLGSAYIFPDNIINSYYYIVAVDLPAGSSPEGARIELRSSEYNSISSVFTSSSGNVATCLPFANKTKVINFDIAAGEFTNFVAKTGYQKPYKVRAVFYIDNGRYGTYTVDGSGVAKNSNKNNVITNNINTVDVVFSDVTNTVDHVSFLNFDISNNLADAISVTVHLTFE